MGQSDDFSGAHFDWLVQSRSNNQASTLRLYKLIEEHDLALSLNVLFQADAQNLAAIAFSLWRAVFLSDLKGELGGQLADIRRFLQSLIAHNAILYQTDFNAREWTFKYYLENAIFRLERLSAIGVFDARSGRAFEIAGTYTKDDWTEAQSALDQAVTIFAETVAV